MNNEVIEKIEGQWRERVKAHDLKLGTMKYRRSESEYFAGAMAAIDAAFPNTEDPNKLSAHVPPRWVINIMSGKPVVDIKPPL